jgi:hypothetical protein
MRDGFLRRQKNDRLMDACGFSLSFCFSCGVKMRKTSSWNVQWWGILPGTCVMFLLLALLAAPGITCAQEGGCKTVVIQFKGGQGPGNYPWTINLTLDAQQGRYTGTDSGGNHATGSVSASAKAIVIAVVREGKENGGTGCRFDFSGDAKGNNVYEGDWRGSSGCS